MLLEYPELLIVVPYLDKVVDVYKNYPKIGCASPEVATVWLCRSTLYVNDEIDNFSESVVLIASEDSEGSMNELFTVEKGLDYWLDCPIKIGFDTLSIGHKNEDTTTSVYKTCYTLFELLLAIPETFTYETGIRD